MVLYHTWSENVFDQLKRKGEYIMKPLNPRQNDKGSMVVKLSAAGLALAGMAAVYAANFGPYPYKSNDESIKIGAIQIIPETQGQLGTASSAVNTHEDLTGRINVMVNGEDFTGTIPMRYDKTKDGMIYYKTDNPQTLRSSDGLHKVSMTVKAARKVDASSHDDLMVKGGTISLSDNNEGNQSKENEQHDALRTSDIGGEYPTH